MIALYRDRCRDRLLVENLGPQSRAEKEDWSVAGVLQHQEQSNDDVLYPIEFFVPLVVHHHSKSAAGRRTFQLEGFTFNPASPTPGNL